MSSKKMITLKSLEGWTLEVEEAVANKSLMIKKLIEDEETMMDEDDDCDDDNNAIHLRKVTNKVLTKVMEYCKRHVDDEERMVNEDELKAWDQDFVVKADKSTLCNLLLAAHYLNI